MPFPMVHLSIAMNILQKTSEIAHPSEFLLGSVAPDSVHFRPDYNSDMKKASHLCVSEEKWGWISNNAEWTDNVLAFLERNKRSVHADFYLGYCSHILADIRNNIHIWTPFRQKHADEIGRVSGSLYHKEAAEVDYELYKRHPERKKIWELLERAEGIDMPGMVYASEISEMMHKLLHVQFNGNKNADVSGNRYVTLEGMEEFISAGSEEIRKQLLN